MSVIKCTNMSSAVFELLISSLDYYFICCWVGGVNNLFFNFAAAVLGKVQNFLGVISEANKKLQEEAKVNYLF